MKIRSILIAAAAVLFSSAALAANPINARADSGGLYLAATLAPVGSFEWQAAPSYTKLAVVRRAKTSALRKGLITVEQMETAITQTDQIRSLLDKAVSTCAQDNRTGRCTKDAAAAARLLKQANRSLARFK